MHSAPVPVMGIGHMRVLMAKRCVPMPVAVLTRWDGVVAVIVVAAIMPIGVFVLQPATPAAGVGCVREFAGPMTAVWGSGITFERQPKKDDSPVGRPQTPNRSQPVPKDSFERLGRCVPLLCCRVQVAFGKKKAV